MPSWLQERRKPGTIEVFVEKIDQPVPVILIEVMLIEVNKNAQLDTGIYRGWERACSIKDAFPSVSAVLALLQPTEFRGYQQLRALNLGSYTQFLLQLQALESGTVKILSSPKMATLNGHRAVFSNSEISYYAYPFT